MKLEYKGYEGSVSYSETDEVYHGKILNIKGVVLYEGKNMIELEENFKEAVDDYIDLRSVLYN